LLLLRDWLRKNKPRGRFYFAYFGRANPRAAGIDYELASLTSSKDAQTPTLEMPTLEPGSCAVSVTLLQGRAYMIQHSEVDGYRLRKTHWPIFVRYGRLHAQAIRSAFTVFRKIERSWIT
jgi:hypothetical protein